MTATNRLAGPPILAYIQHLRQLRMPSDASKVEFPASAHRSLKRAVVGCTPSSAHAQMPPLVTTADFQRWLAVEVGPRVRIFSSVETQARLVPHIESIDSSAPIVFTHVVSFVDWEMAGSYPEWVEAEVVGHYRADDYKDRRKAFAEVICLSAAGEGWGSPGM
ncbi:hypothetical protein JCM10295v2_005015 [Rhodotorula toruloides]